LPVGTVTAPPAAKMNAWSRLAMKLRRSANSTSPRPRVHNVPGEGRSKPSGMVISYWLRFLMRCSYTRSLDISFGPAVENAVVQTDSLSGYAFSVKNARGKFKSPRGHPSSLQSVQA
jgi:hypothetical protein